MLKTTIFWIFLMTVIGIAAGIINLAWALVIGIQFGIPFFIATFLAIPLTWLTGYIFWGGWSANCKGYFKTFCERRNYKKRVASHRFLK